MNDARYVAKHSYSKDKGDRFCRKPIGFVSLKTHNQGNKLPFSGLQTVRKVEVVCDITYL
jgi:hypothetical protein